MILNCPICKCENLLKLLSRENVPVHENLIFDTSDEAKKIQRGNLSIVICTKCEFVFNQSFDIKLMDYGNSYENAQNSSLFFNKHVSSLIDKLINKHQIQNSKILEIGCGNGYFLKKLTSNDSWNNFGVGYDPSFNDSKVNQKNIRIEKKFFDETCDEQVDVIISRHTIEHIPQPIEFLKNIRKISKSNTRIFLETPTVEWIIKNHIFWDFTYEHCSFFTKNSLVTALQIAGFKVISIDNIFEGQYLWIEAISSDSEIVTYNPSLIESSKNFQYLIKKKEEEFNLKIKKYLEIGKVGIWGAAGKGVCLTNILDPDSDIIECLIDLNPKKWGKFISGTGHEIINYPKLKKRRLNTVIVMNPNYYDEIDELIKNEYREIDLIKSDDLF